MLCLQFRNIYQIHLIKQIAEIRNIEFEDAFNLFIDEGYAEKFAKFAKNSKKFEFND